MSGPTPLAGAHRAATAVAGQDAVCAGQAVGHGVEDRDGPVRRGKSDVVATRPESDLVLVEQHGVSRGTVRSALALLVPVGDTQLCWSARMISGCRLRQ